jgi:hypothetical protein
VLGSTGVRIIGQLQLNEGKAVGPDMGLTAEQIKTLRNYPRSHAEWYIYIRSVFDKARRMSAPYGALASMPKPKAEPAQTLEPPPEPKQPPPEFDQLNNPKTGWDIMQERADKAIADNNKSEPPDAPPQAHLSPVQQERVPPTRERPSPAPQTITHLDANARIDKALRLLTSALRPVVENQLRRVHGAHWRQHVSVAAGSDPNDPLDPYAALKTVLDNWQSSFKDSFKVKTRTDVSRAYDARNAIAHAVDELPPADAISYLTAIRDIAIAISADAVTNTVKTFIADQLAAAAGGSTKSAQMRPDEPLLKPGKDW